MITEKKQGLLPPPSHVLNVIFLCPRIFLIKSVRARILLRSLIPIKWQENQINFQVVSNIKLLINLLHFYILSTMNHHRLSIKTKRQKRLLESTKKLANVRTFQKPLSSPAGSGKLLQSKKKTKYQVTVHLAVWRKGTKWKEIIFGRYIPCSSCEPSTLERLYFMFTFFQIVCTFISILYFLLLFFSYHGYNDAFYKQSFIIYTCMFVCL